MTAGNYFCRMNNDYDFRQTNERATIIILLVNLQRILKRRRMLMRWCEWTDAETMTMMSRVSCGCCCWTLKLLKHIKFFFKWKLMVPFHNQSVSLSGHCGCLHIGVLFMARRKMLLETWQNSVESFKLFETKLNTIERADRGRGNE